MAHKNKQTVLRHLKEDSETWKHLAKKATREAKSDLKLIRKVKRLC